MLDEVTPGWLVPIRLDDGKEFFRMAMVDVCMEFVVHEVVRFDPADDSDAKVRKGASGVINDDGSFELFTRRPGDGVHLGKYVVTFAFFRSATDQRPLIPSKYTRAATSPYQLVVDKDVDDLQFEIDSAP